MVVKVCEKRKTTVQVEKKFVEIKNGPRQRLLTFSLAFVAAEAVCLAVCLLACCPSSQS